MIIIVGCRDLLHLSFLLDVAVRPVVHPEPLCTYMCVEMCVYGYAYGCVWTCGLTCVTVSAKALWHGHVDTHVCRPGAVGAVGAPSPNSLSHILKAVPHHAARHHAARKSRRP